MKILVSLILIGLAAFCIRFIQQGMRTRRKNKGYLITVGVIAALDVVCAFLTLIKTVYIGEFALLVYYLLHAWLLWTILLMIVITDRTNTSRSKLIPSCIIVLLQTFIVAFRFSGSEVFAINKEMMFGTIWIVANEPNGGVPLFLYNSYNVLWFANILLIIIILTGLFGRSARMFRQRYLAFGGMLIIYALIYGIILGLGVPVWMPTILYNAIVVICLYYTADYSKNRLREWSLDRFADNMSDGLILYDVNDDLIHINAMIRRSLHAELVRSFVNREVLDEWLSNVSEVENVPVLSYEGPDRTYYFRIHTQELIDKDIKVGNLYILHDNSESINRIRSMHRANEELERAGRMKSDFLANMSHEIRTPMNAVIGMAEIALRENDPAKVDDYLRQIQSSGKNLLNIINDILDYSKIESGKMEIIEEEFSPFEELSDIANVLSVRIGEKPLELFVLLKTKLPHRVIGDAMRIRQVLINLSNNAIKFTNEGMVKIEVTGEELNDRYMNFTIHVVDTGIGIKKEDLDKLFESFQQVDSKRNRSVEGTGLGLAISKRLVSAMGGKMGVESEYGKGSDFWFSIPLKISDPADDLEVSDASGKHVYIFNADINMVKVFVDEVEHLGATGSVITSFDSYKPSGKKEFLFIDERDYDDTVRVFLLAHPDISGVILVQLTSDFASDIPNVYVLKRPETTMSMVRILNERYEEDFSSADDDLFRVDFEAPDARVLVVDDNEINLTIAEGLMASMKIVPDKARGGQEAIEKVTSDEYDIVFMDHMMPDVDGVEATICIRKKLDSMIHPIIIALSANVVDEAKRLFNSAGMNDFVAKPIDIKDLSEKIRKWLPDEKIISVDPDSVSDKDTLIPDAGKVAYEGLDTATALSALGSVQLYDKILKEYCKSGQDKYAGIKAAYDAEDWTDYTIRVHALKSSSRQIGAMALGSMAEELENAGKASDTDTIRNKTDATLDEFMKLLDALETYYSATGDDADAKDKLPVDREMLLSLMDELKNACDDLDMDAMESVSERLDSFSYNDEMRVNIDKLQKSIGEMDTEVCVEIINGIVFSVK